jgi:hypothetical protein
LRNILKVGVKQFIITKVFLLFFLLGCEKAVPRSELVFKDCRVYSNEKLFTGKYELYKGDLFTLTKVIKGEIRNEKTFKTNILLMEKIYDSCGIGVQKNYDNKGVKISEGRFINEKRAGIWNYYIRDSIYLINY